MGKVILCNHPIIQHKLSILRDQQTASSQFRTLLREIACFMSYEVARDFKTIAREIQTPLALTKATWMEPQKIVLVPILRAGLGMLEGALCIFPDAKIGHIGLVRDHESLESAEYYCKIPPMKEHDSNIVVIIDPMLATGGSAAQAVSLVKKSGYNRIMLMNLLASPEGLAYIQEVHPEIDMVLASIDDHLNEQGYIVPGLGDAGDRLFDT